MRSLFAILIALATAACSPTQPKQRDAVDSIVDDQRQKAVAIFSNFAGRYEADGRNCKIPLNDRDDGEESELEQDGGLVIVRPNSVYMAEWEWPIRKILEASPSTVRLELKDSNFVPGKSDHYPVYELGLDGKGMLIIVRSGEIRVPVPYFRCPNV